MRKIICVVLIVLLLCGCSPSAPNKQLPAEEASAKPEPTPEPTPETPKIAFELGYQNVRAYKDSIDTQWIQVVFEVKNTGSDPLYLNSGSYDIENTSGKLVSSSSIAIAYPQVIGAGESAYYYDETTIQYDGDLKDVTVLVPRPDVEPAKVKNIKLPVTDVELKEGSFDNIEALGRVENITDSDIEMGYVSIALFDKDGAVIGMINQILMDKIPAGQKVGFQISSYSMPADITIDDVASFRAVAYPDQMQF